MKRSGAQFFERVAKPMAYLGLDTETAGAIYEEFLSRRDSSLKAL